MTKLMPFQFIPHQSFRIAIYSIPLILAMVSSNLAAQDFEAEKQSNWHQWRGPNASGVTTGDPPISWDASTNIKWKFEIDGEGSSTPIIWNDQVFVLSAVITDRKPETPPDLRAADKTRPPETVVEFVVWSIDREKGEVSWKKKLTEAAPHEGRHPSTTYAAASPCD